jgi:hypothetical protein
MKLPLVITDNGKHILSFKKDIVEKIIDFIK